MEAQAVSGPRAQARHLPVRHALLSDERLARLVSGGDERAFSTLYERYNQPLYRYCRSMLRHDADAQDALQSAMTRAYAALQRSQRDAPVRPWLFRIAHNESVSVFRRRRPAAELTDELGGAVDSVEEHQNGRARLALLLADLKELPERQRGALVMRELSGLSHEDIALALGTSVGGAKQAIFEARRALSEFAEGREMSCEEVCRVLSDADGRVLRGRRVRAHLRDCASCSAFAAAIPARSADLRALVPPLPAVAAAGLLTRSLGGSSAGGGSIGLGGGGAGFGSGAGIAGGLTGKAVTLGLVTKAVAGVVVVSAATVGITNAVVHATAVHHTAAVHRHASGATTRTLGTHTAAPGHSGSSGSAHHTTTAAANGRAVSVSPTGRLTTPAAVHATGSSTHAAPFHTSGKSSSAPSAAVGRGVVTPPGQAPSSTKGSSSKSGGSTGKTTSSTKSLQGETQSSTHNRSTAPPGQTVKSLHPANPQSARSASR